MQAQKEQKGKEEKKKDQYRIPKRKPEPTIDVEKLMNSLFDDTEVQAADGGPAVVSESTDHRHKQNGGSSSRNVPDSNSSSQKEKSVPSNGISSDRHKNKADEHSSHSHRSDKSLLDQKLSSSVSNSGKQSGHKSSQSSNGIDEKSSHSAPRDHKHKPGSDSAFRISGSGSSKSKDPEHSGKNSSSGAAKHSLSNSSSKVNSSTSSESREPSSSKSSELKSLSHSSKNASSPRSSDQNPIALNKHHLNPTIERQASAGLSEKEKILARLQAIKQRTLEAIQQENSGKGKRVKGERSKRKSKSEVKHDDKAKSAEIIKDVPSSDDEDTVTNDVPSALDIMLSERNAKLEKEKIARLAKQAWERATKKDTGDDDKEAKVKKKQKSIHSHKHKAESDSRNNHKRKAHSLSPDRNSKKKRHSDSPHSESRKTSPKPKKQVIVKHSAQVAPPPMDFKAILEMAEKKQKEPPKQFTSIPKKKKEIEGRPLTQEEKDRRERMKSKEYQDWLKFGGKPPTQKDDLSDDEDKPPAPSSHNSSVDKKQKLQHSAPDKLKGQTGSSKQSFSKSQPNRDGSRLQQQGITNGDSTNKHKNITVNENVLVCGPAVSSDDEGSPNRSENPFDKIMNKFHKKRPVMQTKPGNLFYDYFNNNL